MQKEGSGIGNIDLSSSFRVKSTIRSFRFHIWKLGVAIAAAAAADCEGLIRAGRIPDEIRVSRSRIEQEPFEKHRCPTINTSNYPARRDRNGRRFET